MSDTITDREILTDSLLREFGITEDELHKLPEVNRAVDDFFDSIDLCGDTCLNSCDATCDVSCGFTCDVSCGYTVSGS